MVDDGGSGTVAGDGESAVGATGDSDAADRDAVESEVDESEPGESEVAAFDWRGWLLVAVVVLSFVVVPVVIVLRPPQLPFEAAFLALPMVPALLLGATAVWAAVTGRGG